jgi:maleylacetate reductase
MTSIWGITDGDLKQTGRDDRVAPRIVVYDPALTLTLPPQASAASGMNAIAHAVEALYARMPSPIAAAAAEQAIRLLARALPAVVAAPSDVSARALALRGAHLAGVALQHASMGLHHKLCHVLGGTFGLPHAETHAALLPHVVQFNASAAPDAMARIAEALGEADAATGLHNLNKDVGLESRIGTLGFRAADIDRAAELVATSEGGLTARAFVRVSTEPAVVTPAAPVSGGESLLADPSILLFGALIVAALVGLGVLATRKGRPAA